MIANRSRGGCCGSDPNGSRPVCRGSNGDPFIPLSCAARWATLLAATIVSFACFATPASAKQGRAELACLFPQAPKGYVPTIPSIEADFDGDRILDHVRVSDTRTSISFQLSGGKAYFLFELPDAVVSLAALDLDQDGDLDACALTRLSRIVVWINDGRGVLRLRQPFSVAILSGRSHSNLQLAYLQDSQTVLVSAKHKAQRPIASLFSSSDLEHVGEPQFPSTARAPPPILPQS